MQRSGGEERVTDGGAGLPETFIPASQPANVCGRAETNQRSSGRRTTLMVRRPHRVERSETA